MAAVGLDDLKASLLLFMADCSITSLELRSPKACISPKLWDLASLLQRRDSDDDEQHTRTLVSALEAMLFEPRSHSWLPEAPPPPPCNMATAPVAAALCAMTSITLLSTAGTTKLLACDFNLRISPASNVIQNTCKLWVHSDRVHPKAC